MLQILLKKMILYSTRKKNMYRVKSLYSFYYFILCPPKLMLKKCRGFIQHTEFCEAGLEIRQESILTKIILEQKSYENPSKL